MKMFKLIYKAILWLTCDLPVSTYKSFKYILRLVIKFLSIFDTILDLLHNLALVSKSKSQVLYEQQNRDHLFEQTYRIGEFKLKFTSLQTQAVENNWHSAKLTLERQLLISSFEPYKNKTVAQYLEQQEWFVNPNLPENQTNDLNQQLKRTP